MVATAFNVAAKKHVVSARRINPYRQPKRSIKPLSLDDMFDFLEPGQ